MQAEASFRKPRSAGSSRARSIALTVLAAALLSAGRTHAADPPVTVLPPVAAFDGERLTLEQAVVHATERNPTARVAANEIARAEALVRQARAASFPTLTGNAMYTRIDAERTLGTGAETRVILGANQLSANLTLSLPLVATQQWVQWGHASDNVEVSRATAADIKRQVALAAARAYLAVISQQRVVDVSRRAVATAAAHYDFSHARLLGGVGNRIDEVRARQEMLTDRTQLEGAEAGLMRAREALGVMVGAAGAVDAATEPALGSAPALGTALDEAVSQRLDVRAAGRRLSAAERVAHDGWTDYMPLLVGNFQPFYQNPPTLSQPLTGWQATLVLSLPLYDGGARYGRQSERDLLAVEAHEQLDAALRQARSDVRVAFEAVRHADDALASAVGAAGAAHEALDMATLAYRAGATTNLEVTDAERRARDADTVVAMAEDGARQARLDLLAARGRFP